MVSSGEFPFFYLISFALFDIRLRFFFGLVFHVLHCTLRFIARDVGFRWLGDLLVCFLGLGRCIHGLEGGLWVASKSYGSHVSQLLSFGHGSWLRAWVSRSK